MPKSSKKTRDPKAAPEQQSNQIDFTLADYADAAKPAASRVRMKKGAKNALINEVTKNFSLGQEVTPNDLNWYEKDLDDFDSDEEDEDGEKRVSQNLVLPAKKTLKGTLMHLSDGEGVEYPVDIWFHISRHILPEDIGRFAGICRSSHYVVHTAQFWTHLYWRFPPQDISLPEALQPAFMNKIHGLRTRVIRTLFYTYLPCVQRVTNVLPFEDPPEEIAGSQCILMWYQQVNRMWHFHFKFHKPMSEKYKCIFSLKPPRQRGRYSLDRFETDLYDNPDDGSVVLQVVCRTFISIPPIIMGMTLYKTSVSVGHGMMNHRLKMIFASQAGCVGKSLAGATTVSLDPVINFRVFNWWEPKYPR